MCVLQADYEDLRNRVEPLSSAVQELQAEMATVKEQNSALTQQLQQVGAVSRRSMQALTPS